MRENILKEAQGRYQEILRSQEEERNKFNEITAYVSSVGKDFIDRERNKLLDMEQIVERAILPYQDKLFEKKIYVYMGSFLNIGDNGVICVLDKNAADYIDYRLLTDEFEGVVRTRNQYKEFEENNEVLNIKGVYKKDTLKERYKYLQYSYFKQILEGVSEEEALKELKKHL